MWCVCVLCVWCVCCGVRVVCVCVRGVCVCVGEGERARVMWYKTDLAHTEYTDLWEACQKSLPFS